MKFFSIILLFFIVAIHPHCKASHIIGMDISYTCLGSSASGDNYLIELVLYRDCAGVNVNSVVSMDIQSVYPYFLYNSLLLYLDDTYDIPSTCSGITTCNGGTAYGVQANKYSGTIFIDRRADWQMSVSLCCRNAAVTTVFNNGGNYYYVGAMLNNKTQCNSSARLLNNPVFVTCVGQTTQLVNGSIDPDGDSLAYELVTPLSNLGPIVYNPPFSYMNFLDGVEYLNPSTGVMTVTPYSQVLSMYAVLISEYRNGVLVGTTTHDCQIFASNNCQCALLPVTWGGFTMKLDVGYYVAQWSTLSEVNCDYFELQRSVNGVDYSVVTRVQGSGNSSIKNEYFATDYNKAPYGEFVYYRVAQYDYDGRVSYSEVVCVLNDKRVNRWLNRFNVIGQRVK